MINHKEWAFANAKRTAAERGMVIIGLYGAEPNNGNTEDALLGILKKQKKVCNCH